MLISDWRAPISMDGRIVMFGVCPEDIPLGGEASGALVPEVDIESR